VELIGPAGKTLEQFDVIITTFQTLASELGAHAISSKPETSGSDSELDGKCFGNKTLKKGGKGKKAAHALFDVKWLRIVIGKFVGTQTVRSLKIIDEAQNIKNKNTKAAKAAVALRAKYRWCLTGYVLTVDSDNSVLTSPYSLVHPYR